MKLVDQLNRNLNKTLQKGRVALTYPKGCPSIALHLFDVAVLEGPLSHDEAQAVVAEPAYWSFSWASGQVLSEFILSDPALVRGKVMADFGSGSGIVAIAAAKAGAKKVYACDTDTDALDAVKANALANKVDISTVENFKEIDEALDLITAADVLYDPDNLGFLDFFNQQAKQVLLADSRIKKLPSEHYFLQTTVEARTWPDLNEFEEFNQVRIYLSQNGKK